MKMSLSDSTGVVWTRPEAQSINWTNGRNSFMSEGDREGCKHENGLQNGQMNN